MRLEDARFLTSERALATLRELHASSTPRDPLQLISHLRNRGFTPEQSSMLATQIAVQRGAERRLGPRAASWLLTPDGAQQASRAQLAAWHAERFVAAGITSVCDLGCGIGADSAAFAAAGLEVRAVEADPATAVLAAHNLVAWPHAQAMQGFAEQTALNAGATVWADPARRVRDGGGSRRTWDPSDFTPALDWVFGLAAAHPLGVKLGPGHPHEAIPAGAQVSWVSHRGEALEMSLWFGDLADGHARWEAVVLGEDGRAETLPGDAPDPEIGAIGAFLYEPDPAVIRARAIGALAAAHGLHLVHRRIAYLTGDHEIQSPFAAGYRVLDTSGLHVKQLQRMLSRHDAGEVIVKKRGVDLDPAAWSRRLSRPAGRRLVIIATRHGERHVAILAEPIQPADPSN